MCEYVHECVCMCGVCKYVCGWYTGDIEVDYKSVHKYLHRGQLPAVAESPPELVWQLLRSRERLTQTGVRESTRALREGLTFGARLPGIPS